MLKLSVAIISVPKRYDRACALADILELDRHKIVVDVHHRGSWWGHKTAWEALDEGATHQLTLEEDVMPCYNFMNHFTSALEVNPNSLITPYVSRAQHGVGYALKHDLSWIAQRWGASGQGVCMPVDMLKRFLTWERIWCPFEMPYEDSRLWAYAHTFDILTYVTVPQLIEHTAPMDSSLGFNNRGKVAYQFKQDDTFIDWTKGLINPRVYPYDSGGSETVKKFMSSIFDLKPGAQCK